MPSGIEWVILPAGHRADAPTRPTPGSPSGSGHPERG
jgi:hypothetical protein